MFVCSFVLALALGPDPEVREPPADGELPHWRELPEPSPESQEPPKPPKVPSDGSGMIALGGILLGTGGTLGLMSIGLTIANEPRTRSGRELAAFSTAPTLGAGIVFMTLGLVIRRQFRASEAASIPDAPRTGGGMIFGGIGLMLGGTAFAAQALVALSCAGEGCYDTRPVGVPIQLGCALASRPSVSARRHSCLDSQDAFDTGWRIQPPPSTRETTAAWPRATACGRVRHLGSSRRPGRRTTAISA